MVGSSCQDKVNWKTFGSNNYWHPNYFLRTCKSYDFNEFVRKVFSSNHFVSELYSQYAHKALHLLVSRRTWPKILSIFYLNKGIILIVRLSETDQRKMYETQDKMDPH